MKSINFVSLPHYVSFTWWTLIHGDIVLLVDVTKFINWHSKRSTISQKQTQLILSHFRQWLVICPSLTKLILWSRLAHLFRWPSVKHPLKFSELLINKLRCYGLFINITGKHSCPRIILKSRNMVHSLVFLKSFETFVHTRAMLCNNVLDGCHFVYPYHWSKLNIFV